MPDCRASAAPLQGAPSQSQPQGEAMVLLAPGERRADVTVEPLREVARVESLPVGDCQPVQARSLLTEPQTTAD